MLQRCFKEVKAILLSLGGASIKSTWGAQLILTSLKEDSGNERQIVRFRRNSSETASRFHNSCLFVMPSSEAKDHQAAVRDVERAFPTPDEELTHPALPSRNSTRPAGDARRQPTSSSHPPLCKASSALCEIRPLTKGFHWHHRRAWSHRDGAAAAAKIITSGCLL